MARYAADTSVSVSASKAEIERILERYGADQFLSGWSAEQAMIGFTMEGRQIRFILTMPDKADEEFTHHSRGPRMAGRRRSLHHYLIAAVATVARPDAVLDINTAAERDQWHSNSRILSLNPKGRRQTKKYRPVLVAPWQFALHLDGCKGFFVPVKDITGAWETMRAELGWPSNREYGPKVIRRSMAKLLRDRLPRADWSEVEMLLGHARFDRTSDIYAPFDPSYLAKARAEVETIIGEIESLAPRAFHRTNTGEGAAIIPISGGKNVA